MTAPEPVLQLRGRIEPDAVDDLVARTRAVLPGAGNAVVCDVGGLVDPDMVAVDALARMQLAARGHGRTIHLRHLRRELADLLFFCGLWEVVPAEDGSGFEAVGQPEEREQGGGVQERVDPADPTA